MGHGHGQQPWPAAMAGSHGNGRQPWQWRVNVERKKRKQTRSKANRAAEQNTFTQEPTHDVTIDQCMSPWWNGSAFHANIEGPCSKPADPTMVNYLQCFSMLRTTLP